MDMIAERLKLLVRYCKDMKYVASQKELTEKLGYKNPAGISFMLNGKVNVPPTLYLRFLSVVPNLSKEWFFEGKGEMLTSDAVVDNENTISRLTEYLQSKGFDELKIAEAIGIAKFYLNSDSTVELDSETEERLHSFFSDLSWAWAKTGEGAMCIEQQKELETSFSEADYINIVDNMHEQLRLQQEQIKLQQDNFKTLISIIKDKTNGK